MAGCFTTFEALVLRETKYKEADRILTLYTKEKGLITVKAPGALRKNSKIGAATQQLSYSDMTILSRAGMMTVTEAVFKESFRGLRESFENYALGCYFAECVEAMSPEEMPDPDIMQLILNSLYALANNLYSPKLIKAAFEMRLMCILGYEPDLSGCRVCGKETPERPVLGYETGYLACRECRNAPIGPTDYLCSESLSAMRYICSAPAKKLFGFAADEEALHRLSIACEHYIISQSERGFGTLDYWKKIDTGYSK